MAINYTLNWSDDSLKAPFTLVGGTIDTTTTSLALTGKSSVNWGERVQENLLHLLENFASSGIAPANPTQGQQWYDAATGQLKLFTATGWVVVYPQQGGGGTSTASTSTSTGSGPTVYGIPSQATINSTITWGVSGGVPNSTFSYSHSLGSGSPVTQTYTLDGAGGFTSSLNVGGTVGNMNHTFVFAGGVTRTASTLVVTTGTSTSTSSTSGTSTSTSSTSGTSTSATSRTATSATSRTATSATSRTATSATSRTSTSTATSGGGE